MADDKRVAPRVPTEKPDADAAGRTPQDGVDRPGFDLGGKTEQQPSGPTGGNVPPRAPIDRPAPGQGATGRAGGRSDVSGGRARDGDAPSGAGESS